MIKMLLDFMVIPTHGNEEVKAE